MPSHLLSVWNPSYASDALDAHLEVLLGWAELAAGGEAQAEDASVWWAKLGSANRSGACSRTTPWCAGTSPPRSGPPRGR